MVVVGQSSVERTYLQAVNKLLQAVGVSETATLLNPSGKVALAMSMVEEARDKVYYHTMWPFRKGYFEIDLIARQMWYDLPGDHHKLGSIISMNRTTGVIGYMDYDDLLNLYPDIRSFPPGAGVGGAEAASQLAAQTHNVGESKYCTIWNEYIGLFPIPDSDFVTLEGTVYGNYWKQAPNLATDYDDIGVPRNLWAAANKLAIGLFRKALEYSDWEADWLVGERELKKEGTEKREPEDENVYYDQSINYNE